MIVIEIHFLFENYLLFDISNKLITKKLNIYKKNIINYQFLNELRLLIKRNAYINFLDMDFSSFIQFIFII